MLKNILPISLNLFLALTCASFASDKDPCKEILDPISEKYIKELSNLAPEAGSLLGDETYDPLATLISANQDIIEYEFNEKWRLDLEECLCSKDIPREVKISLESILSHINANLYLLRANKESGRLTIFNSYYYMYLDAIDPASYIFLGLFQDSNPELESQRRIQALKRLHLYIYGDKDHPPFIEGIKAHLIRLQKDYKSEGKTILYPCRLQLETIMANSTKIWMGIGYLCLGSEWDSWKAYFSNIKDPYPQYASAGFTDLWTLKNQIDDYNKFLHEEVLPHAQEENKLPRDLYQAYLSLHGVKDKPEALIDAAQEDFHVTKKEFIVLAQEIAQEQGWVGLDSIEILKKLEEESTVTCESDFLKMTNSAALEIKQLIEKHQLTPLPNSQINYRFGDRIENSVSPYPHVNLPRFIHNQQKTPSDFCTFVFGNWNSYSNNPITAYALIAHEGYPGHANQFNTIIERQLDLSRSILSFNSANIEGWGLYAEEMMRPYFPKPQQLGVLKFRLLRQARMFLDPQINLKQVTKEDAKKFLREQVGLDEVTSQIEIERYTYRMPGQATAYHWGYRQIMMARGKLKDELGSIYSDYKFHDAFLGYGLLPISLTYDLIKEKIVKASIC